MTRLPVHLLAVAAAILVIGCSSPGAPSPSPASLDGHTYLSTNLQGGLLVPGTRIRLSFVDGGLNANGGCNSIGGTYAIDGDHLRTTQLSMTEMACEEPRMQQDDWLGRFLGDVAFTLAGDTLTLTDGNATLTLLDEEVATPDQPLEGTKWILDGIVSGDAVSSVPVGVTASMRIVAGQLELAAGCNQGGGSVEVTPDTLTFGPLMLTKMACEAGPGSVESAVVTVLSGKVAYTIDADTLTLDARGAGLMFRVGS